MTATKRQYHLYHGKKYRVITGKRGGTYIKVDGKVIYIRQKQRGGGVSKNTQISVYANFSKKNTIYQASPCFPEFGELNNIKDSVPKTITYEEILKSLLEMQTETKLQYIEDESNGDKISFKSGVYEIGTNTFTNRVCKLKEVDGQISEDTAKPIIASWNINKTETNIQRKEKEIDYNKIHVLVVGDIHGDIIALYNTFAMWRKMQYIDNNDILQPNVYVISLGDLVDYGTYSVNVLFAMIKLRSLNPGRVMILTGNHEGSFGTTNEEISGRSKFNDQYCGWRPGTCKISFPKMQPRLQNIGPSMIYLYIDNDACPICLMHGMYPIYNIEKVNKENPKVNKCFVYPYKKLFDLSNESIIVSSEDYEVIWNKMTVEKRKLFADLIQWNDLASSDTKDTLTGRGGCLVEVGKTLLFYIMKEQKIKAFIRGHQDFCSPIQGTYVDNGALKCSKKIFTGANCNRAISNNIIDNFNNNSLECYIKLPDTIIDEPKSLDEMENRIFTISMAREKLQGYLNEELKKNPMPIKFEDAEKRKVQLRRDEQYRTYPPKGSYILIMQNDVV